VVVKDRATGEPTPALVRAIGDEILPPTESGSDGRLQLKLPPGPWEIIASNPKLGIGGTEVQVTIQEAVDTVEIWLGRPKVELTKDEVRLDGFVLFEVGSARIEPASIPLLTELARTLMLAPEVRRVRVEGHTDDTGDSERNMSLSEARARAVMDWLVDAGVSPDRLEAQGFGEQQPAASNEDDAGRLRNRRVVMRILEREAVGEDATQ
jgi:outer membrane protein OmpA-like peptidoglycan-associated protein